MENHFDSPGARQREAHRTTRAGSPNDDNNVTVPEAAPVAGHAFRPSGRRRTGKEESHGHARLERDRGRKDSPYVCGRQRYKSSTACARQSLVGKGWEGLVG
ncbi:hypothetical protein MPTK1_1g13150 [Marchantia polymorpha subsp. ruderalis]|uniref:Uncharacterized protein n=2 Tax=Marchantia polymorpha TaxID=3197 RepID=A0AAF6APM2_MARPO|nr:hypothetical protein MARPO_0019s0085 [Marchantia polymorpha]BBM98392.1 hypothetical protein Mp_1g13150 [Marchantia polymorpha subsp. ruderalis]|eukprot:PTQ44660.1 hypothetical protein MARPO_0019s0085 [Marchantia polymorpha]